MAQSDLTSHHVNYLIWRYLQESGHGEAAVSLQRAWYPDPQSLPFAPHIKTHALVSLVQKGLEYHELESSIDREGNPVTLSPVNHFFGPEPFEAAALKSRETGTDHPAPELARDRAANGHATETGRKRKVEANGDPMDIDTKSESKSESSVLDREVSPADEVPEESTPTVGPNTSVQIPSAKAVELTPDATYLNIDHHVLDTAWRPGDPTILLTRGETQCTLWRISHKSPPRNKNLPPHKKLPELYPGSQISAVAWDSWGSQLAVASSGDMKGTITMYNAQGEMLDLLPALPRVVSGLYFAKNWPGLAVVASDGRTSELAVWDSFQRSRLHLPPLRIEGPIYDLAWVEDRVIFAVGDGVVYQCEAGQHIRLVKEYKSEENPIPWTFLRVTQTASGPVAVVANAVSSSLWIPTHDIRIENPQQGTITGIDIRPQSPAQQRAPSGTDSTIISIVSYSVDGTVYTWSVDLELKEYKRMRSFKVGAGKPTLAAGFSPDGYALAAVSQDQLYIWNADRDENPVAVWKASDEVKEEIDHAMNGHNGLESTRGVLSWDADGKKLAYGFGNKFVVLNLFSKNSNE